MKITGFLVTALFFFASFAGATYNVLTRWEGDRAILNLYGNYGHPLSEEIRLNNERKKALHIFNLLESSGQEVELSVELHPLPPFFQAEKTVQELSVSAVEDSLGITLEGEEEINPVHDRGVLLYQKWFDGKMRLKHDGNAAGPAYDRAFDFFGKRGDNILKAVDGKLKYIDEVDWRKVKSLEDYSVERVKWVSDSVILAFAEHDMSGRRYIAKTRFRTDEEPVLLIEDPGLLDAAVEDDPMKVVGIQERAEGWAILTFLPERKEWADDHVSPHMIYLLGVIDGEVVWWNAELGELHFSGGSRLQKDIEQKTLELYPRGEYIWGEEEPLHSATPEKVIILKYASGPGQSLEEKGISEITVFDSRPQVWLVPERYRSSFDELPEKIGHAFLSPEDSRVYYNKSGGDLRSIDYVTLRPTVPTKYLLGVLIVILIMLILYDVFKKTKEVTS